MKDRRNTQNDQVNDHYPIKSCALRYKGKIKEDFKNFIKLLS